MLTRLAAAILAASVAVPVWAASPFLQPTGRAEPTRAGVEWCERTPEDCRLDPAAPAIIQASPAVADQLTSVNLFVNRIVRMVADRDQWGVEDRWDLPRNGVGDCEDVALLKRQLLVELGLPRRALLMTVVFDEEGAGHAVLMVRTSAGDVILDNRRDRALPWTRTGYRFVKRESEGGGWVSLGGLLAKDPTP
jgi:predicted transglutaminase-like cysteine proteinase